MCIHILSFGLASSRRRLLPEKKHTEFPAAKKQNRFYLFFFGENKIMEKSKIKICCKGNDFLNLADMTELQGNLKSRTDIDYDKIKLSILKYGFSFQRPFKISLSV